MQIISPEFFLFLFITAVIYYFTPNCFRWFFLLTISCLFYTTFVPVYFIILIIIVLIGYFSGILIGKSRRGKRKLYFIIGLLSTCSILIIFKYLNFAIDNLNIVSKFLHLHYSLPWIDILAPIGLSFQIFQSLSYLCEVYLKRQTPERHLGIYFLSISFFPKLISGPIERPQNILPQLYQKHDFDAEQTTLGLQLILWGCFKKIIIADGLATYVNLVYDNPRIYSGITLITATIFFAYQIYCDFSGYSDIAIGCARIFGIRLTNNFSQPYSAFSIAQFWQRWHISLSSWFKDYVYIPLGGNHVPKLRNYFNILITFLLSGLWHGASWTFVIWGGLHAAYLIAENILFPIRKIVPKFFQRLLTFILVCFAWIFFRANNIHDAIYVSSHLFDNLPHFFINLLHNLHRLNTNQGVLRSIFIDQPKLEIIMLVFFIILIEFVLCVQKEEKFGFFFNRLPLLPRWSIYYLFVFSILYRIGESEQQFIYFRF